jgi:hypothetical protein
MMIFPALLEEVLLEREQQGVLVRVLMRVQDCMFVVQE